MDKVFVAFALKMGGKCLNSTCAEAMDGIDGLVLNHPRDGNLAGLNNGDLLEYLYRVVIVFTNTIHP